MVVTLAPIGVLRVRHWLPQRLRLHACDATEAQTQSLADSLGAQWRRWSGSILLPDPPSLTILAAQLEDQGWWLELPDLSSAGRGNSSWEELTMEVGASLMGAAVGEPLGRSMGAGLAGPAGAAVGSFLGLVLGAVLGTEARQMQRRPRDLKWELETASSRVGSRVAGRLGEEAGALAGLRLGAWLGGPLGASAGALVGTLVVGQLGEDAATHHTSQWRHPWRWLRQTGRTAAGESLSQNLFGLLGGALLQAPGRRAGERMGLYLGRRIDWQHFRPLTACAQANGS